MENPKNQREVENALRDALHYDRARVQTGKISRFGLLELSRQRLRPSLGEANHATCPRCNGTGHIRGIESTALHILRITQEEAMKDNSAIIQVQLPVEAATFLLNEKRADIHKIEQRMGVEVILIPNIHMETPNYSITRIKHDDVNEDTSQVSYKLVELPLDTDYVRSLNQEAKPLAAEALVKGITPATSAPISTPKETPVTLPAKTSIFGRLKAILGFTPSQEVKTEASPEVREHSRDNNRNRNNRDRNRNRNRDRNTSDRQANHEKTNRAEHAPQPRQERPQNKPPVEKRVETEAPIVQSQSNTTGPNGEVSNEAAQAPRQERAGRRNRRGRRDRKPREETNKEVLLTETNATGNTALNEKPVVVAQTEVLQTVASTVDQPKMEASAQPKNANAKKPRAEKVSKASEPSTETTLIEAPATKPAEPMIEKAAAQMSEAKPTKKATTRKPKAKPSKTEKVTKVDLSDAGLQLVETKAETKATVSKATETKPKAPRKAPNWKKNEAAKTEDTPLVMVETQK
jgi:ribonuclease E